MNTKDLIEAVTRIMWEKGHSKTQAAIEMNLTPSNFVAFTLGYRGASRRMTDAFEKYGVSKEIISDYWSKRVVVVRFSPGKIVGQFTLDGKFIKQYRTTGEAARQTGYSRWGIQSAASGRRKTYLKFLWRYTRDTWDLKEPGLCQHCGQTIGAEEKVVIGLSCLQNLKDKERRIISF